MQPQRPRAGGGVKNADVLLQEVKNEESLLRDDVMGVGYH